MAVCGYVLVILGIFFGDLWIKNRIEERIPETGSGEAGTDTTLKSIMGGRILVRRYHNQGAILNLGRKCRLLVTALSVALSVLMTAVFIFSLGQRGNRLLRLGLSILLGGAFSNTYDRLKRQYVVDYFSFGVKWKPLRNIVFNLSDFCIIIGAMLMTAGI